MFSNYQDKDTAVTGPTLGPMQNTNPRNVSPAPPSPYNQSSNYPATYTASSNTYSYSYKYQTRLTTTTNTYKGGQQACQNFKDVASLAKQAGVLIITIGYSLDGARCNGDNVVNGDSDTTVTDTPWISDIQPTACRQADRDPGESLRQEDVLRAEHDDHLRGPAVADGQPPAS